MRSPLRLNPCQALELDRARDQRLEHLCARASGRELQTEGVRTTLVAGLKAWTRVGVRVRRVKQVVVSHVPPDVRSPFIPRG